MGNRFKSEPDQKRNHLQFYIRNPFKNNTDKKKIHQTIEITLKDNIIKVRDYGRGIPLGKVVDVVSRMNTGGKYDTRAFKKSVGLNGVGTKAVNALSTSFSVESVRDGKSKIVSFELGEIIDSPPIEESTKRKGTAIIFQPDSSIFKNYKFII